MGIFLALCLLVPDDVQAAVKVTSVTWKNAGPTMTLTKGTSYNFNSKCSPTAAANKKVKYTSSRKSVAVVNKKGVVRALKNGTADIYAKARDGSGKRVKCRVIVGTRVTKLSWKNSGSKRTVTKGGKFNFNSQALPVNASNRKVTYTSSRKSVATVNKSGVVKGLKNGTAKITATSTDGSGKTVKCTVTVGKKVESLGWKNSTGSMTLGYGDTYDLNSQAAPADAGNRTVTYRTSNNDVCTVDGSGVVTGIRSGTSVVTATTTDGTNKSVSCTVTVKNQLDPSKMSYAGHRGLRMEYPENTVQSFEAASEKDFAAIECDIWEVTNSQETDAQGKSKIEFMVMHDSTTGRMCDKNVLITSVNTANRDEYPITKGNGNDSSVEYQIPELDDYIDACGDKDLRIEIKSDDLSDEGAQELVKRLADGGVVERTILISFNKQALLDVKKAEDSYNSKIEEAGVGNKIHIKTEYLITTSSSDSVMEAAGWASENQIDSIGPKYTMLTEDLIKQVKTNYSGLKITTWTVDSVAEAARLCGWGVDGITTDYPLWEQ